jgi:hypothetical protein
VGSFVCPDDIDTQVQGISILRNRSKVIYPGHKQSMTGSQPMHDVRITSPTQLDHAGPLTSAISFMGFHPKLRNKANFLWTILAIIPHCSYVLPITFGRAKCLFNSFGTVHLVLGSGCISKDFRVEICDNEATTKDEIKIKDGVKIAHFLCIYAYYRFLIQCGVLWTIIMHWKTLLRQND